MIIRKEDTLPEVEKAVKNFVSIFGQKTKWHLHSSKWNRLKSTVVFQNLAEIRAELIQVCNNSNREPALLTSLVIPVMPCLKQLNLKNNKIQSIQNLRGLDCPHLVSLNLADNHLTRITRSLNKVCFPRLQVLILYANNIVEISSGSYELNFNFYASQQQQNQPHPGLVQLVLGVNRIADMRWVNKLGASSKLRKLSLENNRCTHNRNQLLHWKINSQNILI